MTNPDDFDSYATLDLLNPKSDDLGAALDALADLRDRLDHALTAGEQHQAARGRAVNAAQAQLACMERARDVLLRLGELDEAALVQEGIRKLQEGVRGGQ